MKTLRFALAGLLALFAVSASAQQFPVVPDHSVVGRIGTVGQSGPSQAIPFATLVSQLNAFALSATVTTDYAITVADCGKTIQASSGYFGITLPVAAGFPANCSITVVNGDTGSGKRLSGFPAGLTSRNMLWPLQSLSIRILNGTWTVTSNPGRWKAPTGTVVYMNAITGNDTNDCLAPATACQSFNGALRTNVHDYFDLSGSSTFFNNSGTPQIFVQLADNATAGACSTCYSLAHIAFGPIGAEGRSSIVIKGNSVNPGNVVIADTAGPGLGFYGSINVELYALQVGQTSCGATPLANAGIQAYDGAKVRIEANVIIGCVATSQISHGNHGSVTADEPFSIAGGGQWFIQGQDQSEANVSNVVITCIGASLAYSQQVVSEGQGAIANMIGTSYSGAGCSAVSGSKFNVASGGQIYTGAGCSVTACSGIIGSLNGTIAPTGSIDNYIGLGSSVENISSAGDTNTSVPINARTFVTSAALTAPRTWNLPLAASVSPGYILSIYDEVLGVTSINTLTMARAGADTIIRNGASVTSAAIQSAGGSMIFVSDGVSKWLTSTGQQVNLATDAVIGQLPRANLAQGVARSVIGVTGNATANVADIQGAANQALVVNNAGTGLAFGAVNLASGAAVTGVLPFANGGSNDSGTAPSSFTPSAVCGTATFAAPATAKSRLLQAKLTWVALDITISALGTCAGVLTFTLPSTANSSSSLTGPEVGVSNNLVGCKILGGSATATCLQQGGAAYSLNSRIIVSGTYENQ